MPKFKSMSSFRVQVEKYTALTKPSTHSNPSGSNAHLIVRNRFVKGANISQYLVGLSLTWSQFYTYVHTWIMLLVKNAAKQKKFSSFHIHKAAIPVTVRSSSLFI